MLTTERPSTRPRRLSGRTRKIVLIVHIASALAWLGVDIALGALVLAATVSADITVVSVSYQALDIFVLGTVLPLGLLCLLSGVVLGVGSKYGLVRYWWVAVKLVLNVVLVTLVLVLLAPGLELAAEYGRRVAAEGTMITPAPDRLLFPPIVSVVALTFATVISVFKPWGRTRSTAPVTR